MILFVSRYPPNPAGPGGSQRAMHLLKTVARYGPVDFLLLHRSEDTESALDTLDAVRPLVRSTAKMEVQEWAPSWRRWPRLSWKAGQIAEAWALHSVDAPRFSGSTLAQLGRLVPEKRYQLVFAVRLSSARIADDLIARGFVRADRKVVDLDDRLSAFKRRALASHGGREGRLRRWLQRLDVRRLRRAEFDVTRRWDAVSLANGVDAAKLRFETGVHIYTVPNVVDRPLLPRSLDAQARILFVGHLGYSPNVLGLARFLDEVWPSVKVALPHAQLDVVGMFPDADLARRVEAAGARLNADVPSVEPFYAAAHVVIAPIWSGGGTRIKILEAMAYGRAVVSTGIGAEGLGVESGRHALLADAPHEFADAVIRLGKNADLRDRLAAEARALQQSRFGVAAIEDAVGPMLNLSRSAALT